MPEERKQGAASDHLANERTYLAWVRTSIGIMAFGFVVVKFSLFVKQISLLLGNEAIIHPKEYSSFMGIVLVSVGTITAILSYIQYKNTEYQLNNSQYKHSSLLITILTGFIFLVSIFLVVYLIQSS
jgi:putative membrane protein